jgi:hypothetical protein
MPITITAEQRNLLYDDILTHLSGIGDIELALNKKDYETAHRLGLVFSDELRLMSEDLGWEEEALGEAIELRTPPDVLRRALSRLRDVALAADAGEEKERAELRENTERNHLIVAACRQVLAELKGERRDD